MSELRDVIMNTTQVAETTNNQSNYLGEWLPAYYIQFLEWIVLLFYLNRVIKFNK